MSKIYCIASSKVPSSTANSIQVMKACDALVKTGHQVHLILPGDTKTEWDKLAKYYGLSERFDIQWLHADPKLRRYDFSWFAVERARKNDAELIYAWPLQAALLAAIRRLPVLLEIHGPPEGRFGPLLFRLLLRTGRKKRYLPITQALASMLERDYNYTFSSEELVIAPNGVDIERYDHPLTSFQSRQSLGLPDRLTAAYTGHLYPGRGMDMLIALAERFPKTHFLWVGGLPAHIQEWKRRLSEKNIHNVTLTGFVENSILPQYQYAADILLMPYERFIEGSGGGNSADYCSPMKMFEYLAAGRAIISSDLPVIKEVLNESNAILCHPEDESAWVSALGMLLDSPEKRQELARNAKLTAHNYTWKSRASKALAGFI